MDTREVDAGSPLLTLDPHVLTAAGLAGFLRRAYLAGVRVVHSIKERWR